MQFVCPKLIGERWSYDIFFSTLHFIWVLYGHHIWSSYMMIIYDHHIWSSYMIIIYRDRLGPGHGTGTGPGHGTWEPDMGPVGFPTWGGKKYYLLSHQPESGRCGLQVILFWHINPTKNIVTGGWNQPLQMVESRWNRVESGGIWLGLRFWHVNFIL